MRKWTTISQYVDIETGEIITREKFKSHYIIIKTEKNVQKINQWNYKTKEGQSKGIVNLTHYCRNNRQLKLFE